MNSPLRTTSAPVFPDARGRYGAFGGRYVPETLVPALDRLQAGVDQYLHSVDFQSEFVHELNRQVWREVLGLQVVSRDVPILDLGADSLHIFRIAARLHAKGIPVQARDLLSNPTIAKQGELADRALAIQANNIEVSPAPRRDVPTLSDYRSGVMRNRQAAR